MVTDWLPHEIIWLEAAYELQGQEKIFALRDIAELTNRPVIELEAKLKLIAGEKRAARALLDWARTRVRHVPGSISHNRTPNFQRSLPPSQLKQPTEAQKMAGRAR